MCVYSEGKHDNILNYLLTNIQNYYFLLQLELCNYI